MKRLVVLVVALAFVAAGCKVDTQVSIDVHDDGSGTVSVRATLDPAAVRATEAGGAKLEGQVRLDDLRAAGWTVSPWTRAGDGSAQITLSKAFGRPEDVTAILAEVSGTAGPIHELQ